MSGAVLDASAVLALIRGEPGGSAVDEIASRSLICAVNLTEVVSYFIGKGFGAQAVDEMLRPLSLTIADADEELAYRAGHLRADTRHAGLSLGDRFCLALASREGLPAWTADRQWEKIADSVGVDVVLIR